MLTQPKHVLHHRRQSSFTLVAVFSVMLGVLAIMMFTGYWPTHINSYNSYVRQACAWLNGQLDLDNGAYLTWLELAIYDGKYYVSFPPFPSYVLLPFAAIWRLDTSEALVSLAFTVLAVLYACRIYRLLSKDQHGLLWVLFLFFGTGYMFISFNGWVWFIAQNMCFSLSLIAIYHALRGQGVVSLACWACAVGCRPMVLLYLPILLWLLYNAQRKVHPNDSPIRIILRRWYWAILPLLIGGSYMLLNYLRFGDALEFGHNYLPEFVRAEHGQFSLTYIWDNMLALLRLPRWVSDQDYLSFYTMNGMAFWLTNPLLVTVTIAWGWAIVRKKKIPAAAKFLLPLLTLAYVLIICAHRTLGGWHFGNRYLLDIMPWLFLGLLYWKPRSDQFAQWNIPVCVFAAFVNMIGTVAMYNNWI